MNKLNCSNQSTSGHTRLFSVVWELTQQRGKGNCTTCTKYSGEEKENLRISQNYLINTGHLWKKLFRSQTAERTAIKNGNYCPVHHTVALGALEPGGELPGLQAQRSSAATNSPRAAARAAKKMKTPLEMFKMHKHISHSTRN